MRSYFKSGRLAFLLHFSLFLFSFLFGPHFASATSFAHILRSGTPIDDPSSPTRHTSKHLPILTILFSFEWLECATLVALSLCLLLFSCAFLLLISHAIVCFGIVYTLSKHVSAKKCIYL